MLLCSVIMTLGTSLGGYKIIKTVGNDNLAFKMALMEIADAHEKILDLYNYTLYEDTWTETTINQFEDLL